MRRHAVARAARDDLTVDHAHAVNKRPIVRKIKTTVARAMGQRLRSAGVRHVFGHPGGAVLDLIDGFASEGLEFVLPKHEATAGFMADVVGAFSGAPGVCLGTLGPGATNLVTGVAQAYLDRSP